MIIVSSKKPVLNYVTACITAFNSGHKKVLLRARGSSISNAVDVVRLLRTGFLPDLVVENVEIGSEEIDLEGERRKVSYIEILVSSGRSQLPQSPLPKDQGL